MARGRPKTVNADPPSWFAMKHYAEAIRMDAADWYLNLRLRIPDTRGARLVKKLCEAKEPLLRREHITTKAQATLALAVQGLPGACQAILRGNEPEPSVYPVSVSAFYWFERTFPQELRDLAKDVQYPMQPEMAVRFRGDVDDVHGGDASKQMLARFVRVDLSRPDEVLREDFDRYLARQRMKLAEIPGDHPYREALDSIDERYALSLVSLANHSVLPYLDLDRWRNETGATMNQDYMADLLQINLKSQFPETRRKAALLQKDFVLSGWLLPEACKVMRGALAIKSGVSGDKASGSN